MHGTDPDGELPCIDDELEGAFGKKEERINSEQFHQRMGKTDRVEMEEGKIGEKAGNSVWSFFFVLSASSNREF